MGVHREDGDGGGCGGDGDGGGCGGLNGIMIVKILLVDCGGL